ncbi:Rha family transcriptional regulator [Neisseria meningitidis]|uniref:Rha family transcriptional regulator n=1 Tax=Neisseria meningitidis TaxID=487 RepID=UPI000C337346|nr:Rha family transcriptional regulator [Neisseria meningitidis]MCL6013098.1 Rha family transcriptional regulator [Neisseria meningitidis]MCL6126825.1 Rha family transcriptional regulator [Neisseria meningitidis]
MNAQSLVRQSGNRLITTSLDISRNFGKKHAHILRDIKNLECSKEFNESNFGLVYYTDAKGEQRPMYEITRDGFVFLCMGFTGSAAAQWKEKYIAAFNALEAEAARRRAPASDRLKAAYLSARPDMARLLRYTEMGLNQAEAAKLLGIAPSNVRSRLKRLADLGLTGYRPDPKYRNRHALATAHGQQSLGLEG